MSVKKNTQKVKRFAVRPQAIHIASAIALHMSTPEQKVYLQDVVEDALRCYAKEVGVKV